MKYSVTVIPNAKMERVEQLDNRILRVRVKSPAKEGKANKALVKLLACYFNVSTSRVIIISGLKGRRKVVRIVYK